MPIASTSNILRHAIHRYASRVLKRQAPIPRTLRCLPHGGCPLLKILADAERSPAAVAASRRCDASECILL